MTRTTNSSALVLFSGGQDSTVCLAWALERYAHVETAGFDYGQRHKVELVCRDTIRAALVELFPVWAGRLGEDHLVKLDELGRLSETALTREAEIVIAENGLPTTFVPGRNLLFFTYAAALGYRRGIHRLIGGMCETDYSGYPDCRDDTLKAQQVALSLGLDRRFTIETPLMWLNKAETFALARDLGGASLLELIVENTHSCYMGDRATRHDWGYGCNACPACDLRAAGWLEFQGGA